MYENALYVVGEDKKDKYVRSNLCVVLVIHLLGPF